MATISGTFLLVFLLKLANAQYQQLYPSAACAQGATACYQGGSCISSLQDPCRASPNCGLALGARCLPCYCAVDASGASPVGQPSCVAFTFYFVSGSATAVPGCPTTPSLQVGSYSYSAQYPSTGVYGNSVLPGQITNGAYSGAYGTYANTQTQTQSCSQLAQLVLGPSASNSASNTGRRKRRQTNSVSNPQDILKGMACNDKGCWATMVDPGNQTSTDATGRTLLQARWHQTHKLVFLQVCDPSGSYFPGASSSTCQYGQVCCQIGSLFGKYYCLGNPVNPYSQSQAASPVLYASSPVLHLRQPAMDVAYSLTIFFVTVMVILF